LKSLIGWLPDTPIETTLKDMVADYKARYCHKDGCPRGCQGDCTGG